MLLELWCGLGSALPPVVVAGLVLNRAPLEHAVSAAGLATAWPRRMVARRRLERGLLERVSVMDNRAVSRQGVVSANLEPAVRTLEQWRSRAIPLADQQREPLDNAVRLLSLPREPQVPDPLEVGRCLEPEAGWKVLEESAEMREAKSDRCLVLFDVGPIVAQPV